jgi:hypothetical protein
MRNYLAEAYPTGAATRQEDMAASQDSSGVLQLQSGLELVQSGVVQNPTQDLPETGEEPPRMAA